MQRHEQTGGGAVKGEGSRLRSWEARLTVAGFLLCLWLPALGSWLQPTSSVSGTEQRFLAARPPFPQSWKGLVAYPGKLEAYSDDHLGFRENLIRAHAFVSVAWLGVSPSSQLIAGKQGWFFLNHPDAVAQYRGLATMSEARLARWRRVLEERRDWLAERGIAYVFVLVPNKHMIYPEFMSDQYPRAGEEEHHRQLAAYLKQHSDVPVVDLMPLLLEAKRGDRVYHRTDTHWNDIGAYAAYGRILEAVSEQLEGFAELSPPIEVRPRTVSRVGMGLTSMVGLSRIYREETPERIKVSPRSSIKPEHRANYSARARKQLPLAHGVEDPRLPRAVMFRDSFANALIPYLAENFRRILFVWDRDVDPRVVEIEKPDVVIQEYTARLLGRAPLGIEERLSGVVDAESAD